jgi:hypothetical protein
MPPARLTAARSEHQATFKASSLYEINTNSAEEPNLQEAAVTNQGRMRLKKRSVGEVISEQRKRRVKSV